MTSSLCCPVLVLPGPEPGVASGLSTFRPLLFRLLAGLQFLNSIFAVLLRSDERLDHRARKSNNFPICLALALTPKGVTPHSKRRFKSQNGLKKTAPPVWRGRMVQAAEGETTCESDRSDQSAGRHGRDGRSRGDRRPARGPQRCRRGIRGRQCEPQRSSSSRAPSSRWPSSRLPRHIPVRGMAELQAARAPK